MKTHVRIAIVSCLPMLFLIVPISHFAFGDPPRKGVPNEAAPRAVPPIPTEASHAHNIRLRVLQVCTAMHHPSAAAIIIQEHPRRICEAVPMFHPTVRKSGLSICVLL